MPNEATPQQPQTAVATAKPQAPVVVDSGEFSMLMDSGKFAQLQRIGTMYARSKMVPQHFQGDEPSCMVAVQMAMRLNIDPFMFLQKTYVVGGKPGMEAPLVIALINTRGPFKGPVNWDLKRDDKGEVVECTAYATHRETGTVCSSTVTWKMVEAEGWSKKNGSKWLTLREQMFKYRSAAFLGRLYCPEVLMGMATADELHDEIDVTPAAGSEGVAPLARPTLKDRLGVGPAVIDGATGEPVPPAGTANNAGDAAPTKRGPGRPPKAAQTPPPNATVEELVDAGQIVIHDDPATPAEAAQNAAAATESAGEARSPQPTPAPVAAAPQGGGMPYESTLAHARKAKTRDQVDLVRDVLKDAGYPDEQRLTIEVILNSKKFEGE